jgi:hypothetical protein
LKIKTLLIFFVIAVSFLFQCTIPGFDNEDSYVTNDDGTSGTTRTSSGNKIVDTAMSQIGRNDSDCGGSGCYGGNGSAWCSEFVSWVYKKAGYPFSGSTWLLTSTSKITSWFSNNSTYITRSSSDWSKFTPRPGDYVYIGRAGDPKRKHSGIVRSIGSNGTCYTIEGNNSGRDVDTYSYPNWRTNTTNNSPDNGIILGFGLRTGKNIRLPNGTARASSSGNNRPPKNAFDQNSSTFWRNRTNQSGTQYLEMDFNGKKYTVTKVSLTFGSHYARDYRFRFKIGGSWGWSTTITGNTKRSRAHVWFTPKKNVQAVRIYCTKYSADDYFSLYEMKIQK